ncbi:cytochrome c oxidase subunit mitochondrial, partial [Brachionus plicatilis]
NLFEKKMSFLFRKALGRIATPVSRRSIATTPAKRSGSDPLIGHVEQEANPGSNIPFNIQNRYKLAALMIFYFGSAFAAPFLVVRHQLLKKNS